MCPPCTSSLATVGYVCQRGGDLHGGLRPSGGPCGAVLVDAGCLPPPQKKFQGFRELEDAKGHRLLMKVGCEKAVPLNPEELPRLYDYGEKRRSRCLLVGPAVAGATPFVSSSNLYNAAKAVLGRVFRRPAFEAQPGPWSVVRRFDDFLLGDIFA
jgi:hypothetical protein